MKYTKQLWFFTIFCFVITLISFSCLGTTFAKYTSKIQTSNTTQAAGFLVTAGGSSQTEITSTQIVAPGQTISFSVPITYFSQVDTEFITLEEATITGTGFLQDFSALLSEYETYKALHNPQGEAPTSVSEMFSVSFSNNTNIAELIVNELVALGLTRLSSTSVAAMESTATTALTINLPLTITWVEHNDPNWDTWDSFVGSKFYQSSVASTITLNMAVQAQQII